jgi:hypothetical protein
VAVLRPELGTGTGWCGGSGEKTASSGGSRGARGRGELAGVICVAAGGSTAAAASGRASGGGDQKQRKKNGSR